MTNLELITIVTKFKDSSYELISLPSRKWLLAANDANTADLIDAVAQADVECGNCGCELDPFYKRALELLHAHT